MKFKKTTDTTLMVSYFCYFGKPQKAEILRLKNEFPNYYFFSVKLRRTDYIFDYGIVAIPVADYDSAVADNKDKATEWYSADWVAREKKNFIYKHKEDLKKFPRHSLDVESHVAFLAFPKGTLFI